MSARRPLFDLLTEHRRVIYLVVAMLSGVGLWSTTRLPSAIYPELTFPRVTIVVQGSSLGVRQVVFGITRPIEEAISIVPGVTRVTSKTIRGAAEIAVTFAERTEMQNALQLVQARVNQIGPELPPGLDIQVERMTPSLFPILSYNLEGGDPATLYDIARYEIKPVVSRIPGVGRVDVQGSDVREIEVVADPGRLSGAGLTYDDVAKAIRESISVDAVGRVSQDYKQYLIVSAQEARSVGDIERVVVRGGVRVADIASVSLGTEDHVRVIAGNGRPAALLNITRQIGGNTIAIADSVAHTAAALARALPPGVRLTRVYDQAALVRNAVVSVRDAMLIGAALAVLVLLLFLQHVRITAISATAIPLTLVITVLVMRLLGQSFNLMTLGAMAIAIGLVIDDAVVITENIVRQLGLHADRTIAVRQALEELIWPVTTSTLTTVVVFLPLGLLEGVVGQFFKALSVTLTVAVLVSLVLALTIIPLLSVRFLTPADVASPTPHAASLPARGMVARLGASIDALSDRYERTLGGVLHHVGWTALAALALLLAGVLTYRQTGTGFLPAMDEGSFVLDYVSPGGTALAETDRQVHVMERILAATPEIAGTSRRTGAELGLFATQQNSGDIVARLVAPGARDRTIFEIMDDVRTRVERAVPRLRVEFVQILSDVLGDLEGASRPVEIKLFGPNLDTLEAYARRLAPEVEKIDGMEDFFDGVSEPSAELYMHIDGAQASRIGITPQQVSEAVRGSLLGVSAGEVRSDDRTIAVRVRAPDSVRFNARRLGALPVASGSGSGSTPLSALATFEPRETRAELTRENQQQMITMTADVVDRPLGSAMDDVKTALRTTPAPGGIRIELGGQYAGQQRAFGALLAALALAAVSVMLVMVVQFRSFVEPLTVVLVAPLSFVGALALLLLTGTQLNVSSFMGLILLVGLIVKNGIILLDFTRHRMLEGGLALEPAIRDAARIRLRPILMTTLCTLFGLLPLALGIGAGSELQRPLALAVIGGLTLSTPLTLFIVPVLVVAARGRGYRLARSGMG